VLWAGTEINVGVVAACLPSLRPIFLLIRTGSAKPPSTKGFQRFDNTYALKNSAVATLASRGRNVKAFSGTDTEDEHHSFSIIQSYKNTVDKQ